MAAFIERGHFFVSYNNDNFVTIEGYGFKVINSVVVTLAWQSVFESHVTFWQM